jgi:restriction system protein
MLILLTGTLWAHKAAMLRLEHIGFMVGFSVIAALIVLMILRLLRKVSSWRLNRSPDMAFIDVMDGLAFEKYVSNLLKGQGYRNVQLTEEYDYGIDIIAERDGIRWGIQVKRYSGLVKAAAVRQAVTALRIYNCDRALVVTNSSFSRVAQELADSNNCILVDRNKLLRWIEPGSP